MKILGLDLSLTGSGVVLLNEDNIELELLIKSKPPEEKNNLSEIERISKIKDKIISVIKEHKPDLVSIEGMAFMVRNATSLTQLSFLNYSIREYLWKNNIKFLIVSPKSLKKFITGNGNADKEEMMMTLFSKYHIVTTDDNISDACALGIVGRTLLNKSAVNDKEKEVIETLKKQL